MSHVTHRRKSPRQEEIREIEVLIYSAQDLKNVKHITRMRTFAEIYVEKSVHVARTRVDEHGGENPTWNEVVKVRFHKHLPVKEVMAALNVDIYADSHVGLQKLVGCYEYRSEQFCKLRVFTNSRKETRKRDFSLEN
ncbi:hypothetical protein CASFOL_039313 [Castilleja foliolosa]|uniref:C2 domain-containing protein n=1 Tax=Castilleja foliolosa TaxID=1961234 RepID=A0ABD3BI53_9LAMI